MMMSPTMILDSHKPNETYIRHDDDNDDDDDDNSDHSVDDVLTYLELDINGRSFRGMQIFMCSCHDAINRPFRLKFSQHVVERFKR
jgi:hypothetical protein